MDTALLMYCAGLLDGEGSIYFHKRKYDIVPMIAIGITHKKTAYLFHKFFGGSVSIKIYKNPNHNTKYTWKVSSRKALNAAILLIPYSNLKYHKLLKILDHYNTKCPRIRLPSEPYFAGLIDGEGYVGIGRQSTKAAKDRPPNIPIITVEMTDEFMINSIKAFFHCGSINYSDRAKKRIPNRKPTWRWAATFNCARYVATLIYPYAIIKKEKLDAIISIKKLHRGPQGRLTPEQVRTIRKRREMGETCNSIAADYAIHPAFVGQICLRKWYAHVK